MYKYLLLGFLIVVGSNLLSSQRVSIPMQLSSWDIIDESMKFDLHKGVPSLHVTGDGLARVKDISFKTGIIEFDYYATGRGFCGIYFRQQDTVVRTPLFNSEFFYLRSFKIDDIMVPGSMQYAPITRGTNLWNLLHDYEANALIKSESWNHVKLVISDEQMKCYLNGIQVLWIPELLGPSNSGYISLEGKGIYSNLQIDIDNTEDVPQDKGADLIAHDVRYLKDWEYAEVQDIEKDASPTPEMFPDSTSKWTPISAGRGGLVNLTQEIGSPFIEGKRKVVWLSTTLESSIDQVKRLNLGFNNDIWVYVNGRLLHVDRNTFGSPIAKQPNGRLHIDNVSIELPLKEGENTIWIALANDFFGWGLVARLNNMNEINGKMMH